MEREKQQDINHDMQETVKPSQYKNPKATKIQELFAGWEDDGLRHQELDWGKAEGNELKNNILKRQMQYRSVRGAIRARRYLQTSEGKDCRNQ